MPRLSYSLIRRARQTHPFLPLLLRACRDLQSARNELRWLTEFANKGRNKHASSTLLRLCQRRSTGWPLQYILGDQPFGDLQIFCRPRVLIPRPETESYTSYLAERLIRNKSNIKLYGEDKEPRELRILDLCTGTGCIALLLHRLLSPHFPLLRIRAYDIDPTALALAERNRNWNIRQGNLDQRAAREVEFCYGDVRGCIVDLKGTWDIIVSNPPYISPMSFLKDTARSVRRFEPRLALVPLDASGNCGDQFHAFIASIGVKVGAKAVVIEGDGTSSFAEELTANGKAGDFWVSRELWKDDLSTLAGGNPLVEERVSRASRYRVIGSGHERADVLLREEGLSWFSVL